MKKDFKKNRRDDNKFEFKLTINDHIICQRYFPINNHDKGEVYDVKGMMDTLTGMNNNGVMGSLGLIPNFLKQRSVNYLWRNYKPYEVQKPEDIDKRNIFEKEDIIGFELRCDGRLVAKSAFSGNYFPTKVRYDINIKEIIPDIFSEVRDYMSSPIAEEV